jgi:hypothetical protein
VLIPSVYRKFRIDNFRTPDYRDILLGQHFIGKQNRPTPTLACPVSELFRYIRQPGSSRWARTPRTCEAVLPSGTSAKVADTPRRVAAISRRSSGSRLTRLSSSPGRNTLSVRHGSYDSSPGRHWSTWYQHGRGVCLLSGSIRVFRLGAKGPTALLIFAERAESIRRGHCAQHPSGTG